MDGHNTSAATLDETALWVGVVLLLVALPLPFMVGGYSEATASLTGWSLVGVRTMAVLAVGLAVVGGAVARRWLRGGPMLVAAVGAVTLLGSGLTGILGESVSASLPSALLPAAARRVSAQFAAGPGLWLTALAGAAFIRASWAPSHRREPAVSHSLDRRTIRMIGAGAASLLLLSLRYQPWCRTSGPGLGGSIPGWALPWVGVAALVGTLLAGGGCLMAYLRPRPASGLAAAFGAWLVLVSAAATMAFAHTVGTRSLSVAHGGIAIGGEVEVRATPFPLGSAVLALGLCAAALSEVRRAAAGAVAP